MKHSCLIINTQEYDYSVPSYKLQMSQIVNVPFDHIKTIEK